MTKCYFGVLNKCQKYLNMRNTVSYLTFYIILQVFIFIKLTEPSANGILHYHVDAISLCYYLNIAIFILSCTVQLAVVLGTAFGLLQVFCYRWTFCLASALCCFPLLHISSQTLSKQIQIRIWIPSKRLFKHSILMPKCSENKR